MFSDVFLQSAVVEAMSEINEHQQLAASSLSLGMSKRVQSVMVAQGFKDEISALRHIAQRDKNFQCRLFL